MKRPNIPDIVLTALLLAVSFVLLFCRPSGAGAMVEVSVGGRTVGVYSLFEEQSIPIPGTGNVLTIADGSASMTEAGCPDHLCVKTGKISKKGQTIVCLPARVTVRIIGEGAYDAVSE